MSKDMERKYSKTSKSKPDLWKEQAANLPGQKSVLVLLFKQTTKQNGEDSSFFFKKKKKHKILPRQRLTASCLWHRNYLGRVIMKSIKAANHILEIQKQELIQGEMPFHKCFHPSSGRSERLCPNTSCSSCSLFVLELTFHKNTGTQLEAIPAGLPSP